MTTQAQETSVRTQITIQAPIERAFKVFTADFARFKPLEHNLLGVEIAETVFEPRAGGRLYDRGVDGSECDWARVLAYEPPSRVAFSWDLNPQTSEFTRVELEHRNIDRHGEGWRSVRDAVGSEGGWPLYLRRFAELFEA